MPEMKKRWIALLLAVAMMTSISAQAVSAAEEREANAPEVELQELSVMEEPEAKLQELPATEELEAAQQAAAALLTETISGYCGGEGDGTNLTWTLTPDGTLTISGTGAMRTFSSSWTDAWRAYSSYSDSIRTVYVGDSVTSIGSSAFYNCKYLTSVTIGNGVTSIGSSAFYDCDSLSNVTIGSSVTSIGSSAFWDCGSLTSVTIPDSVTSIGNSAFCNCQNLTSVTIGNGVTSIDSYTFSYCVSLTNVTIPDSVTNIGSSAFQNCGSLTNVTIPDSVTNIGLSAFQNCGSLTNVTIGNGVTSIGSSAFRNCDSLTSVTIGNSVTSIGLYAFQVTNLKKVYYEGTESDWAAIEIGESNEALTSATISYLGNSLAPSGTSVSFHRPLYTGLVGSVMYIGLNLEAGEQNCEELISDLSWSVNDNQVFPLGDAELFKLVYGPNSGAVYLASRLQKAGTTTVRVTTEDGASASCLVTATAMAEPIVMASATYTVAEGDTGTIFADIANPDRSDDLAWTWTSSNRDVVAFDEFGNGSISNQLIGGSPTIVIHDSVSFIARNPGSAKITLTLADGTSASQTVTVLGTNTASNQTTIKSNSYNVPVYSRPKETEDEKRLDEYRQKWYEAFENFRKAMKASVENANPVDREEMVEKQAKALMKADESGASKFLSFDGFPKDLQIYAYQALCTTLMDCGENQIDFGDIDFSDEFSAGAGIVKKIASNLSSYKNRVTCGGIQFHISFGNFWVAKYGTITCKTASFGITQTHTIMVCSKQSDCEEMVARYLNALKDLEYSAAINVFDAFAEDVVGCSLSKLGEDFIRQRVLRFEEKLAEIGLKDAGTILLNGYDYYKKCDALFKQVKPGENKVPHIETILSAFEIDSESITDKVVKSAVDRLEDAQTKLTKAFVEYNLTGKVPEYAENWVEWFFSWGSKTHINCPVNVAIYDSAGSQVGYVGDDGFWHNESIYIEELGDAKVIYSQGGEQLSFEMTGTDYGTLSCAIEEYANGLPTGRLNFYDIPLKAGKQISAQLPEGSLKDSESSLTLSANDEEITADEYIPANVNARVEVELDSNSTDGGQVFGEGAYVRGDAVVLRAIPNENYAFAGWFDGENVVSLSTVYEFTARNNLSLKAYFVKEYPSFENYLVNISAEYADICTIEVEQDEDEFAIHVTDLSESDVCTTFVAYLVQYANDGRMISVEELSSSVRNSNISFEGVVPNTGGKLFILDQSRCPVIEAYVST